MRSAVGLCSFLLVCAFPAQAASAARSLQFDLLCDFQSNVIADPHPRYRGDYPANERTWRGLSHLIVDLRAGRSCDILECGTEGPRKIVAVDARRIILLDRRSATKIEDAEFSTVRILDGRYWHRVESNEGYVRVETGVCRRERFSGFPPGIGATAQRLAGSGHSPSRSRAARD